MEKITNVFKRKISGKEVLNFFKENWISIYIIINVLYVLAGSFLVKTSYIFFSEFSTGYLKLFIFNIVAIVIVFITKKYKKDKLHLFILLGMILAIISAIFAKKQHVALVGFMDRWEGIFVVLYYFSIMFLANFAKNKKIIIYFVLFSGLVQTIYGICQVFDVPNVIKGKHTSATGFIQNPNFFGSYMVLNISYAIGLYIEEKNKIKQIIFSLLIVLFMFGLLISNTMSAVVGLFFVMTFSTIYCIKNKIISKIIITIMIIILSSVIVESIGKTRLFNDIIKTSKEAVELASGNADDKLGSGRMLIWKKAIKVAPKYLLHGVGIDNFYFAFDDEGGPEGFDKAHNEYLQILITQGIFSLITYLSIYGIILKRGIKNCFNQKEVFFVLPVIGYLVQAFFNISVIEVAPIFYISLGLCSNFDDNKIEEK